jgi:diguanylate cyclase (GGDEF)-like protein
MTQELAAADRTHRSVSLIMLDLDHFKQVNDKCGHPVGDEVLRTVAKVILKHLRASDFAARYGGEEFVVVLRETDLETTVKVAERLRLAIQEHPFLRSVQGCRVTASLGVSCHSPEAPAGSVEVLLRAADDAMYAAKTAGRNRVATAS